MALELQSNFQVCFNCSFDMERISIHHNRGNEIIFFMQLNEFKIQNSPFLIG